MKKFFNTIATIVGYTTIAVGLGVVAEAAATTLAQEIKRKRTSKINPYYYGGDFPSPYASTEEDDDDEEDD